MPSGIRKIALSEQTARTAPLVNITLLEIEYNPTNAPDPKRRRSNTAKNIVMSLSQSIEYIIAQYPAAMQGPFANSPVAAHVRHDFPDAVRQIAATQGELLVEGSAGIGVWARCPWIAVFDPLITDSAQHGYYPVYLFREDFTGVYLSLNQGVTEVKNRYRAGAKDALSARAIDFRARLGSLPKGFSANSIDLRPSTPGNNSAYYEAGNICSVFYDAFAIPSDQKLADDLLIILEAYSAVSDSDPDLGAPPIEGDEPAGDTFSEDHTKFRAHKRLERNPNVAKRVKDAQGFVCKACGFDFRKEYPGITGNGYIEAHHLVPISQLKGQKVQRDPLIDFAVLCSNCHRMIHRSPEPWNLEAFKKTLRG